MTSHVREPQAGEILGTNYLIERELGRGGFGVVYKARHVDIDRVVAIKVLLATYASRDPSAKDRFRREATIAASLSYPNSLKVFDYGETDEGVFYLVMEFVAGEDLTKVIQREGRLPIARAVHIVRQVLYALSEAHARGIVHRDIKPDNIMICPLVYDRDFVKVMDFGIAKMVEGGDAITKAGLTLGTPRYMPIEQLKGERLGPSSDLYAVGLVLYEMLVGQPAFRGDSAVDTALAVMSGPSLTVPPEAGLPPALGAIIEKAAARHAEDRYQSARELLEALDGLDASIIGTELLPPRPGLPDTASEGGHRKTIMMPELERAPAALGPNADFDDVTRTQAIETEALRDADARDAGARDAGARDDRPRVDHSASTQSMPALAPELGRVDVPNEPRPRATSPTETALVTSAVSVFGAASTGPGTSPPAVPTKASGWLGAPPLLVVLHAIVIALLMVLLAR